MAYKQKQDKPYKWKQIRYKAYKYDQLPKEAKQKALEKQYGINVEHEDWARDDFLIDINLTKSMQNKIAKRFGTGNVLFKWKNLYFDLERGDYIQFDGLEAGDDNLFGEVLGVPKKLWNETGYRFINEGERDTDIEFYRNDGEDFTQEEEKQIDVAKGRFAMLIRGGLQQLHKNYDYLTTNEAIEDTFRANEYDFNEKGDIV
jgi:hypothetical protein